jgi:hypothetical protein
MLSWNGKEGSSNINGGYSTWLRVGEEFLIHLLKYHKNEA